MTVTMKAKTIINNKAVISKIEKEIDSVQAKLDIQVLKDSNFYCPMDTGTLIKEGILGTVAGSGRVVWDTPYAREQYYGKPNKSHQKNPNACMKWFEAAKAKRLNAWVKLANEEYSRNN